MRRQILFQLFILLFLIKDIPACFPQFFKNLVLVEELIEVLHILAPFGTILLGCSIRFLVLRGVDDHAVGKILPGTLQPLIFVIQQGPDGARKRYIPVGVFGFRDAGPFSIGGELSRDEEVVHSALRVVQPPYISPDQAQQLADAKPRIQMDGEEHRHEIEGFGQAHGKFRKAFRRE